MTDGHNVHKLFIGCADNVDNNRIFSRIYHMPRLEERIAGDTQSVSSRPERKGRNESGPFLYLMDQLVSINQADVISQYLTMGVPMGNAGEERPHPVSGILGGAKNVPTLLETMKEHITNNIKLTKMGGWKGILNLVPEWSKRHDGAIFFDCSNKYGQGLQPDNWVSLYIIFDGLCNSVLVGFLTERIKFLDRKDNYLNANSIARALLKENPLYNPSTFNIQDHGLWHDNIYDEMGTNGVRLTRQVYEELCKRKGEWDETRAIRSFEDLLAYISPANFSFMNEYDKELRYMGAKSRNSLALALRFPEVTVYCLKDSIYGPADGPTTGTGKFIAIKFDQSKGRLRWVEGYNIRAHEKTYLKKYLPDGLSDHFDPEKHVMRDYNDRKGKINMVATVGEIYEGSIYERGELPRVAAFFFENKSGANESLSSKLEYPKILQMHYNTPGGNDSVCIEDTLRKL